MSEKKSLATEVYEAVLDEMESMYETLLEAFTPPFGQEQVSKESFRRNFYAMSPEQRAELIRQKGADWVLEALRKKGEDNGRTAM